MSGAALLSVRGVTVRFGGILANSDVDLDVAAEQVTALIGPNGAGKTTLFNVITGAQTPSRGQVLFGDEDITARSSSFRARRGVARTFQNLSLVDALTAAENVTVGLGRYRRTGLPGAALRLPSARVEDRRFDEIARAALDFVGLAAAADRPAFELSYGDRRRVEFARALALAPRLLLLDEPSAGMGPEETRDLGRLIRRAVAAFALSVLVVEHDMTLVRSLADRTSVLDFGTVIASGPTDQVLDDARVVAAYLGTGS